MNSKIALRAIDDVKYIISFLENHTVSFEDNLLAEFFNREISRIKKRLITKYYGWKGPTKLSLDTIEHFSMQKFIQHNTDVIQDDSYILHLLIPIALKDCTIVNK